MHLIKDDQLEFYQSELVDILTTRGDEREVRLHVSAGMNLYEIAEAIDKARLGDRDIFLQRVTDPQYAAEIGVPAMTLEGYLSPGDYSLLRGTPIDEIVGAMHARFRAKWVPIVRASGDTLGRV
ncbi:MAG: hypothetical protein L3J02_06995, partial [Henriciella sp.]|nr:hypothetical protein [Henriciella sp.]